MKIEINEFRKWYESLTVRILILAVMGLFLLIPLEMIKSIIAEREISSVSVRQEIFSQWAVSQTLSGPVLNIPVVILPAVKDAEPVRKIFHIMPELLDISGNVNTETRKRSIYEAVVYNSVIDISGYFILPDLRGESISRILLDEAYFTMGISDNRGLKGRVEFKNENTTIAAVPGLRDTDLFGKGITFPCTLSESASKIPFTISLNLSGSEELRFSPLGKETRVKLTSPWSSPGFSGSFLPSPRTIGSEGFTAEWNITNLNRNFPQEWLGNSYNPSADSFGVEFILQADHYQKSLRSAKYGILFIALTFLVLLLAEMTTGNRINILNYLLVSLALILFFSLLSALSEQVGFNSAYLISALSTVSVISLFLQSLIRKLKTVILSALMLILLYSFIYILLSLNDFAYLAGNIGLFVLLSATMWISVRFKNKNSPETN